MPPPGVRGLRHILHLVQLVAHTVLRHQLQPMLLHGRVVRRLPISTVVPPEMSAVPLLLELVGLAPRLLRVRGQF